MGIAANIFNMKHKQFISVVVQMFDANQTQALLGHMSGDAGWQSIEKQINNRN